MGVEDYDRIAELYARAFAGDLAEKPFDRKMLEWFAERVTGRVCDLGCGPGQVAAYLAGLGLDVSGIDLSAGMVEVARRLHPQVPFATGDMLRLESVADRSFGGITSFYSIVHVAREDLPRALGEMARVLGGRGILLLAFHIGQETLHRDEWWGEPISIDFYFYDTREVHQALEQAGFEILEAIERDPYPGVEYQSRRAYLFARKP